MPSLIPKPMHGWRSFVGEVGIIVLGVLIALGAQQFASNREQRLRAELSLAAVREELAIDMGVYDERTLQEPCITRRMEEMTRVLSDARRTRHLPIINEIGKSIARPTLRTAWQEASQSGDIHQWPTADRIAIATIYSQQQPSDALTLQETGLWLRLQATEMMGGPVSDSDLSLLSDILGQVRYYNWNNAIDAQQLVENISALGIVPKYHQVIGPSATRTEVIAKVRASPICQPLKTSSGPNP
ncbi:MAG: hypothetical protein M3R16_00390 [Pseudomonadota bacterium]|nr:hypothetical protein [Pseudomonadota bacterium]